MANFFQHPFWTYRNFRNWQFARVTALFAWNMQFVALGAHIYDVTGSPMQLGALGLSTFLPIALLTVLAGQTAETKRRERIVTWCFRFSSLVAVGLFVSTWLAPTAVWPIYLLCVANGATKAFSVPAGQALSPTLVAPEHFSPAIAAGSSLWQLAIILGPLVGGLVLDTWGHISVYGLVAVLLFLASTITARVVAPPPIPNLEHESRSPLAGFRYVWQNREVLGAMTLDLISVLLGGVTALLPIFAKDVLDVSGLGLGFLRAGPAIGATAMGIFLARIPIRRHQGRKIFTAVFIFGLGTIAFSFSKSLWLSMACLIVLGAADMVSVVVRNIVIQQSTPEGMRGRVSAVNSVFVAASNDLGEFESGLTAHWFGLVPATLLGGGFAVVVALGCALAFPQLRKFDRRH